ncbi:MULTISPECIES: hypothetical protein [Bifidobacterium]|jgi:hypothetical protein|uniref:hypothetical protein n=1 Tax=Bifidobacterium TaxID=1678 RepID=UPI001269D9C4|nr:hypothetical protein [Bifidobacterium tibiigranuli]MCI1212294.1 hypothetical protein [Bifidobacterium tibiigranuli]MCI1221493.1 hypothetical protein [Bifidobacterium tibiigranuli]MCI1232662.1 hypothetical protein [Bifidobacterium tibiigranuli]MCI1254295.1 hypothetical protein [Bifidobacterium tibiigranuli]
MKEPFLGNGSVACVSGHERASSRFGLPFWLGPVQLGPVQLGQCNDAPALNDWQPTIGNRRLAEFQ